MSNYNNSQMRKWLQDFFEDEEDFVFFCEDQFPEVYAQFSESSSFNKKTRLLTRYCEDNNLYDQLIELVNNEDPSRFTAVPPPAPDEASSTSSASAPAASSSSQTASSDTEPDDAPAGQDIFISYSRRDETFVKQLYAELVNRGISTWYDRKNIGIGEQWAEEIVKGIRDCQVFLLSLSPDAADSPNVRKEVDLAQRYQKKIVPLIWRPTEIPVAMEYQLAGIQWIEFNQTSSPEKFDQLADVLQRLIGGASMDEAAGDKTISKESPIPAKETKEKPTSPEGPLLLDLGGTTGSNPIEVGGAVIASVVTRFGLTAQNQDVINKELKWLFYAVDNFLHHRAKAIQVDIPPTASPANPNNKLLDSLDEFYLGLWKSQLEGKIDLIQTHLRNLDILLKQQAEGRNDLAVKNDIRNERIDIVKNIQEMAEIIHQAYGTHVTSPDQLLKWLSQRA